MPETKRESFRRMANMIPEAIRQNSECPLKLDNALEMLRSRPADGIRSMPKSMRRKRSVEYGV